MIAEKNTLYEKAQAWARRPERGRQRWCARTPHQCYHGCRLQGRAISRRHAAPRHTRPSRHAPQGPLLPHERETYAHGRLTKHILWDGAAASYTLLCYRRKGRLVSYLSAGPRLNAPPLPVRNYLLLDGLWSIYTLPTRQVCALVSIGIYTICFAKFASDKITFSLNLCSSQCYVDELLPFAL